MNSEIAIAAMIPSVRAAFFDCGRLKALTPFEIDSTPVSAADPDANACKTIRSGTVSAPVSAPDPDANARKTISSVTVPAPAATGCGTCACGQVPTAHLATPVASTA